MWLIYDGKVYSDEHLRTLGWTDETLRAPYACRVREKVCANDHVDRYVENTKPIDNERDELIDDIEALCLSIETRQNQLSKLIKELKC
jgi:hypothetical protein